MNKFSYLTNIAAGIVILFVLVATIYGAYRTYHKVIREYENTINVAETTDKIKKYCVDDTIIYEHIDSHSITTAGQLCVR